MSSRHWLCIRKHLGIYYYLDSAEGKPTELTEEAANKKLAELTKIGT